MKLKHKRMTFVLPVFVLLLVGCGTDSPTKPAADEWSAMNNGLPENTTVQTLAAGNGAVYAGTYDGVFRRANGSWQARSTGLTNLDVPALAVNPTAVDIVYAGTWGKGVFASTDGGRNWSSVWPNDLDPRINYLVLDAQGDLWAATENGLFRSRNNGATWQTAFHYGSVKTVAVSPHDQNVLLIGVRFHGTFRSTDRGESWTAVNTGLYADSESTAAANCIQFHPELPGTVFISTEWVDLYVTENLGELWQQRGDKIQYRSVLKFVLNPENPQQLWAVTRDDGIYASGDAGNTWRNHDEGLAGVEIKSITMSYSHDALYAGAHGKGVFKYSLAD